MVRDRDRIPQPVETLTPSLRPSGLTLALMAAVLFGTSGVVAAGAFDAIDPLEMARFRSVVAALLLGVVALPNVRWQMLRPHLRIVGAFGVILAAVTITFYWAIDRLGVGPGLTIQFLGPIGVLAWMRLAQHRVVPSVAWWAAGTAVIGTALMNRVWSMGDLDFTGVAAALGAAIAFALYLIVGERVATVLPPTVALAAGFTVSAGLFSAVVPLSLPTLALPTLALPTLEAAAWGQLFWIAVAGTALPFLMEVRALELADPGRIGVVATAEPVVGAVGAWVVLSQRLEPVQVLGGLLVVLGIAALQVFTGSVAPDVPDLAV